MDAVIVELKPTTIAYLQAHQELVPKSCDYTGSAMIVMPANSANYLTFRKSVEDLRQLNGDVRLVMEATSFDSDAFIKRTGYIHQYFDDQSLVVLHEDNLNELLENLPSGTGTKKIVIDEFSRLKKAIPEEKKRPNRRWFYAIFFKENGVEHTTNIVKYVDALLGRKIEVLDARTNQHRQYFKEELPMLPIEHFVVLANQTTYFEREMLTLLLDDRKRSVVLAPKNTGKLDALFKLSSLYTFQLLENSPEGIKALPIVMQSASWKELKETNMEITLLNTASLERLVSKTQDRFGITHPELLRIGERTKILTKDYPNGIFLFCKKPAVKECTRIFRRHCQEPRKEVEREASPILSTPPPPLESTTSSIRIKFPPRPPPKVQLIQQLPSQSPKPQPSSSAQLQNNSSFLRQSNTSIFNKQQQSFSATYQTQPFLLQIKRKAYDYFKKPDGAEKLSELQEKYGIQLQVFSSCYLYTPEEMRDSKSLVRKLKAEKADNKQRMSTPQRFFLYTVTTKELKDALNYEVSEISNRIKEEEVLSNEEEKTTGEEEWKDSTSIKRASSAKEAHELFLPSLETSSIEHVPDQPGIEDRNEARSIENLLNYTSYADLEEDDDELSQQLQIREAQLARTQRQPTVVKKDVNPFEIEVKREFPMLPFIDSDVSTYRQLCEKEGAKLELIDKKQRVKITGQLNSYGRISNELVRRNEVWCELEKGKKQNPIKSVTMIDREIIEDLLGDKLRNAIKFENPEHLARWSEKILLLSQTDSDVQARWVYMFGDDIWYESLKNAGGIKGLMGQQALQAFTDLKQIRNRAKEGSYVALCKATHCRRLIGYEDLKEVPSKSMLEFWCTNCLLPVYIGKLQY